jgi:hypothetical protein
MRWFDGPVVQAIAAAKNRQSLFVVFITGIYTVLIAFCTFVGYLLIKSGLNVQ